MSTIKIKKSKQGSLRKAMGAKKGQKLSVSAMKKKMSNASPAMKKKLVFAINARKWKHEDGGMIPEFSWGGVLADTAAGAGMGALGGAAFGGIGALPGAIIGGAGAFLKGAVGEIGANKEEQQQLNLKRIDQANAGFNAMMMGNNNNPFAPTFALGGMTGNINAEIEKGEVAVSPDGTMRKYQLPSHANTTGDNFKYFDPGTMIFSDKLKFNKSKTFAQQQDRYKKISDNADKTLNSSGSTILGKRTAQLNKQNAMKLTADLFAKQEAMKYSLGGKTTKFDGGGTAGGPYYAWDMPSALVNNSAYNRSPLPGAMFNSWMSNPADWRFYNAGTTPEPGVDFNSMFPSQGALMDQIMSGGKQASDVPIMDLETLKAGQQNTPAINKGVGIGKPTSTSYGLKSAGFNRAYSPGNTINNINPVLPSLSQAVGSLASVSPNNPTQDQIKQHLKDYGVGPDWGGIGLQALSLAPDIYNLGQALFSKPEKIERNRYFNPYTSQIRSRMNDRRFNIDPMLAANRNANAIYNRNVSNASGGDRSRLLSNLLAGQNARQSADASAYSQKINMDNQYLAEQAQMDYQLGAMNANALAMRDDINARNLAAKRNFGASAASGMQQYALNQMQMNNQLASQRAYLNTLDKANPFFNPWLDLNYLMAYGKNNK